MSAVGGDQDAPAASTNDSLEGERDNQHKLGDKHRQRGDPETNAPDERTADDVEQDHLEDSGVHESRQAWGEANGSEANDLFSRVAEVTGDVAMLGFCLIGLRTLVSAVYSLAPLRHELWSDDRLVGWTMWVPLGWPSLVLAFGAMLPSLYLLRPIARALRDFIVRLPSTLFYVIVGAVVLLVISFDNKFAEHTDSWRREWAEVCAKAAFLSYLVAFIAATKKSEL